MTDVQIKNLLKRAYIKGYNSSKYELHTDEELESAAEQFYWHAAACLLDEITVTQPPNA